MEWISVSEEIEFSQRQKHLLDWNGSPPSPDVEVDYNDAQHRYYFGKKTYISATQLISKFHQKFDKREEATAYAEKYGHMPEYWITKWDKTTEIALIRGNTIHNAKEEFLYGRGFDRIHGKDFLVQNINLFPAYPYRSLPDGCYPEMKLWRHDWGIAGRADKPTIETIGGIRYMHIEDYKTNKTIRKEGFIERDGSHRMMFPPLSHLEDCELTHYTLQLSLYQYMAEYFGFRPGDRRIIHFQHEIEGLGIPSPKIIELPYLRNEVILMLKYLKG